MKKKVKNKNAEQNLEESGKKTPEKTSNKEIVFITYIFVLLFIAMMGKYVYFVAVDGKTVINSSYNKRQEALAKKVKKGSIFSADGKVLAETVADKEGSEHREYPYENLFCHVVGRSQKSATGLEEKYGFDMLNSSISPFLQIKDELEGKKTEGDSVYTTLRTDLQQTADEALAGQKGAVVVMEVSTGKILTMLSKPDYDPNQVIDDDYWSYLLEQDDADSALLNRVTNGVYAPGSTFKIVTALAYLREHGDAGELSYECEGSDYFGGSKIRCYNGKVHGTVNMEEAFAYSCNSAFAYMGTTLSVKKWRNLCEKLLFNTSLPVDFGYTKSQFLLTKKSDAAEIAETAMGQGKTTISPLHNMLITAMVANDGVMMKPYVVDSIKSSNGQVVKSFSPKEYKKCISKKKAKKLREYMESVTSYGTASVMASASYTSAGKTGSAEYDDEKNSHAWYVGYAPAKNPEIAIAVIVEGAGTGSEFAVPVAKKVMDQYFKE